MNKPGVSASVVVLVMVEEEVVEEEIVVAEASAGSRLEVQYVCTMARPKQIRFLLGTAFVLVLHSLRSLEANAHTIPGQTIRASYHTTMLLETPAPLFLSKPLIQFKLS